MSLPQVSTYTISDEWVREGTMGAFSFVAERHLDRLENKGYNNVWFTTEDRVSSPVWKDEEVREFFFVLIMLRPETFFEVACSRDVLDRTEVAGWEFWTCIAFGFGKDQGDTFSMTIPFARAAKSWLLRSEIDESPESILAPYRLEDAWPPIRRFLNTERKEIGLEPITPRTSGV